MRLQLQASAETKNDQPEKSDKVLQEENNTLKLQLNSLKTEIDQLKSLNTPSD